MSLFRKPSWCWFVFGLLLAGGIWCGVQPSPSLSPPSAWSGPETAALLLYLVVLVLIFIQALARTLRKAMAWYSSCRPERMADLVARLDSRRSLDRVDALQTLAEACGEPFGPVSCHSCTPDQFNALCLLYKEWWRAGPEGRRFLAEKDREDLYCDLFCRVIDRIEALRESSELPPPGETKYPEADRSLARLPLLPPGQLVAVLRPHVEDTLRRVAGVINLACKDIPFAQSEYRVRRLFTHLCWEAFECGWQLRFAASERRFAHFLSVRRPWVGSPQPPAPSPPSVGWAEKYRRMSAPGRAETTEPAGSQGEMTWAELAAALRQKVDETLDRLNEAIKDALMDGDFPFPSEDDSGESRPLAPLSREQFVEVMRPRIEEALRGMADSLNDSGGADAVGELLETLLRDALQTGLEMRAHPPAADSLVPQESLH
jgi:hypothetical protein